MGDEGSEGKRTAAARAARLRGRLPKAGEEVLDPQSRRGIERGLAQGGARPIERGAGARAVEPVAARRLQPRRGHVLKVATEESFGFEKN